jgi:hypothetical protein
MTLDELVKLAQAQPDARAVTRVIVEALRDELRREWFLDDSGLESVERWMNEILAGVEAEPTVGQRLIKAAKEAAAIAKGEVPAADLVSMVEAEARKPVPYKPGFPAAAPVCEWTEQGFEYRTVGCNGYGLHAYSNNFKPKRNRCPYCKWPVVIKSEAAR